MVVPSGKCSIVLGLEPGQLVEIKLEEAPMKRTALRSFALTCLLGMFWAAPVAHAQYKLAAQNIVLTDTTITPPDITVLAINESPEIMALDVPSVPSSGYVQFSSTAIWELEPTVDATAAPVRANFQLRFIVTSPALPPGINLGFGVLLTLFRRNSNGAGGGFEGATAEDSEVMTRKTFADFLQFDNPSLTAGNAAQIADGLFQQGFHVSVFARLRSQNVSSATVSNPNVAFFAESGSLGQ
jgi:hypothetical protein